MTETRRHPGQFVRDNVIPKGVNVTEAAKRIGVSRPTLSNFLNGKADLSPEMAARLELAFGIPARQLLDLQSAWDAGQAQRPKLAPMIKSYVPPFLQIKARRIEAWGGTGIIPRQRFSVFLRTLINSTGVALSKVDFPGNDDSERAGWDGLVTASEATPWIPHGQSGWEFGINQDPKKKANGDFQKSVVATDEAERQEMAFVFVTPRSWAGKNAWVKEHKAKKLWKDVRAYDSSDLEQWLEQSIPGQIWFASETEQDGRGAISLDEAWKIWAADCEPALQPALFADAIEAYRPTLTKAVGAEPPQPTVITADSRDEALAFLSSAFSSEDPDLAQYRDRVIIFQEPGALSRLAAEVSNFIPVIISREVEKEFAPFRASMPSFIIYPRNAVSSKPDIALETLSTDAFDNALKGMGIEDERARRLSRETGNSPTVLRRRLSSLQSIQTPDWASDKDLASALIPFLFAGAWQATNKTDRTTLELLAGDMPFDELERRVSRLLPLDGAPVWSTGSFRGVVSKLDLLFAISDVVLTADLERFYVVAGIVLSEDNPALELPENQRWAASIYGKTREISGALREGLAESLVLLAVHGPALFKERLGFDPSLHANRLVRELLTPLTTRKLESQTDKLPLYAEAAPETFLSIIEADLDSPDPQSLNLMRPVGDTLFGSSPRTGLLWALENLAWADEFFLRTVLVLGGLAERTIEDNLVNKPIGSLSSIFRSWMPQTGANLERRKAALSKLAEKHPSAAWQICVEQFSHHSRIGFHSNKPRWRPDGHGYGHPVSGQESNEFALHAFYLALNWPSHSSETIAGLVDNVRNFEESLKLQAWDVIDAWAEGANEADRAWLREKVRVSAFGRRAVRNRRGRTKSSSDERARLTYERLEPRDPILRHEWLFKQAWVEESLDEISDENFNFEERDARIASLREAAIREVFASGGIEAVMQLAELGQASHNVGWFLSRVLDQEAALADALGELVVAGALAGARANIISGALIGSGERGASVLKRLLSDPRTNDPVSLLVLAPFESRTWEIVEELGGDTEERYWKEIAPGWGRDAEDLPYAVSHLLKAGRPRAAFQYAHFELKALPPRGLFDLLIAVGQSTEAPKTYMLDAHFIQKAFDLLNESRQMSTDEMSGLEFRYIDFFDREGGKLINLEKRIEKEPSLFAQAVAFAFKRNGEGEDPAELQAADDEHRIHRAQASYKLLEGLRRIPGTQEDGTIDSEVLLSWVEQVRAQCRDLARATMGDQSIGKLLSHAPAAEDGVWPCKPVREVLEQVLSEEIDTGLHVALYNARGAHWRGEGGGQERAIAAKYAGWAEAMEYTHPRVAAFLRSMEKSYLRDAEREDNEAKIARRMRL